MKHPLHLLACASLLVGVTAAQRATEAPGTIDAFASVRRLVEPLPRLTDSGASGFVSSWFDVGTYETFRAAADAGGLTRLERFPLPGGEEIELFLRPVTVWEEGGTARVRTRDGGEIRVAPTARLFAVHVPGRQSRGFLGVSAHMAQGYLTLEGITYMISTGPSGSGPRVAISHEDAFRLTGSEGVGVHGHEGHAHGARPDEAPDDEGSPVEASTSTSSTARGRTATAPAAPTSAGTTNAADASTTAPEQRSLPTRKVWDTTVLVEVDRRVRNRFQTEQEVVDYMTILLAAANHIYRRDAGFRLIVPDGYMRVSNGVEDLWEAHGGGGYPNWFNSPANPLNGIPRGHVNRVTGFGRGSSASEVICRGGGDQAFNQVELKGSFPYPLKHTSRRNWDLYANGMENGHMLDADHTQNYRPRIECDDGTGPDEGTLMSYCAFSGSLWEPSNARPERIGMRFHERVQGYIRSFLRNASCVTQTLPRLGDFDLNGIVDVADLAEFDAVQSQGFRSISAEAVFDINRDGILDATDRALLVVLMAAPASTTIENGSGVNCLCLGPLTQPIMGQEWSVLVGNYVGEPILTAVVGAHDRLDTPVPSRFGEVLVSIRGFGGSGLTFVNYAWTDGVSATHVREIPFDSASLGRVVYAQAVLLKPTGLELTNALRMTVSTY